MLPDGTLGDAEQRVGRKVVEPVALPVVGQVGGEEGTIGLISGGAQTDVLAWGTHAVGKLLRRVGGPQHEGEARRNVVGTLHGIVGHQPVAADHVEQRLPHAALRAHRGILGHHPLHPRHRQVHRVALHDVLGLNGRQHGVGPAEIRAALTLHGRVAVQHVDGEMLRLH